MRARQLTFFFVAVFAFCRIPSSAATSQWSVARNPHFEVYSEAGPESARRAIERFEELRAFFGQSQIIEGEASEKQRPPLRVIGFSSQREYDDFKVRATADAYYTGTEDRDYIVMPTLESSSAFGVAAHEYAHSVLFARGLKLPAWLSEGIAELFSTVRITNRGYELGGPLRARVDVLRRHRWVSAGQLFAAEPNSRMRETRDGAAVFYSESWALVDMLSSDPAYGKQFTKLVAILSSHSVSSQQAVEDIYGKSGDALLKEAQDWIGGSRSTWRPLSGSSPDKAPVQEMHLSEQQARGLMADLLFANGEWARSEGIYEELLRLSPADPDLLASLGTVSLRENRPTEAAGYFRRALNNHLVNAAICYRYALLAEEMNITAAEIERALEQAIFVQPDFDDARYRLALLENNQGEYAAAVHQLQSMSQPSSGRAFAYYAALAYALEELDRREEAAAAARQAMNLASTAEERAHAAGLAYVAATDLAVRFIRDANGNLALSTTRVPHGTAAEVNPFIEPGDHIRTATGHLREVQCSGGRLTGLLVDSAGGTLTVAIPDPQHVLIKHGPSSLYCGPQSETSVAIEFAASRDSATGVLRGMDFK